ncbi:MAG: hypothetical protein AAF353_19020, partial [Pseudomonadota bacterium]
GIWVQQQDQDEVLSLRDSIAQKDVEIKTLEDRNELLSNTLDIVKRQIQTDRIAYDSLQKVVESSEQQRQQLQQQLQKARDLLAQVTNQLQEQAKAVPASADSETTTENTDPAQ